MNESNVMNHFLEIMVRHLYISKQQVHESLASVTEIASSPKLQLLIARHREETFLHLDFIKEAAQYLNIDLNKSTIAEAEGLIEKSKETIRSFTTFIFNEKTKGVSGLLSESKEISDYFINTSVADIALANGQETVEQFEVCSLNTILFLLKKYGQKGPAKLLSHILQDDKKMSDHLVRFIEHEVIKHSIRKMHKEIPETVCF